MAVWSILLNSKRRTGHALKGLQSCVTSMADD